MDNHQRSPDLTLEFQALAEKKLPTLSLLLAVGSVHFASGVKPDELTALGRGPGYHGSNALFILHNFHPRGLNADFSLLVSFA